MKPNNLAAAAALQVLILVYFWAIGCAITREPDARLWSENERMLWIFASALFGTVASVYYLKSDNNEPGK